jgi:hypothetical protein
MVEEIGHDGDYSRMKKRRKVDVKRKKMRAGFWN